MSFINEIVSAVVSVLIRESVYASILFGIIFLITLVLRKKRPNISILLWSLLFVRLILPPNFSHNYSGRILLDQVPFFKQVTSTIFNAFGFIVKKKQINYQRSGFSAEEDEKYYSNFDTDNKLNLNDPSKTTFFFFWLIGVTIWFALYSNSSRRFRLIIKSASPVRDLSVLNVLKRSKEMLNIRKSVKIMTTDKYFSPFTKGFIQPVIVIPSCVLKTNNLLSLEAIIAHELAHVSRHDDLWIKIISFIQIIYFFHPLVWYARKRWIMDRECLCDQTVLSATQISSLDYGKSLISIFQLNLRGQPGAFAVSGFYQHQSEIRSRILSLKGVKSMTRIQKYYSYGLVVVLALTLMPMAGQSRPNKPSAFLKMEKSKRPTSSFNFNPPIAKGRITASFGKMIHPIKKQEYLHAGIDIAAPTGTPIYASADGEIIETKHVYVTNMGSGKTIEIAHKSGYVTRYTHMHTIDVKQGQKVRKGDIIGTVGNTGMSTGPHLHFEIRKDNRHLDPATFIDFSQLKKAKE